MEQIVGKTGYEIRTLSMHRALWFNCPMCVIVHADFGTCSVASEGVHDDSSWVSRKTVYLLQVEGWRFCACNGVDAGGGEAPMTEVLLA